jgi:hypothetical protein
VLIGALDRNARITVALAPGSPAGATTNTPAPVSVLNLTEVGSQPSADVSKLAAAREAIYCLATAEHIGFRAVVVRSEDPEGSRARRRQGRLSTRGGT